MSRIRRWILLAGLCLACLVAGAGIDHYAKRLRHPAGPTVEARPKEKRLFVRDGGFWYLRDDSLEEAHDVALEKLKSLPYVTGSLAASTRTGVTVYNPARVAEGVNLYSSADAPAAFLIDSDGKLLHKWRKDRADVWPELSEADQNRAREYFRRLRLLDNGDLLVIFEYTGIIKLDAQSNLLWAHQGWNNHDLDVDDRGRVYVLGRDVSDDGKPRLGTPDGTAAPRMVAGKWIFDETIDVLSADGELLRRISIVDCLENSRYASLLDPVARREADGPIDLLHSNTVYVLDGSEADISPAFAKGNILTSLRNISTIAIIDPDEEEVVWALSHGWRRQHDPSVLGNGRLLLFDNLAGTLAAHSDNWHSRVIEFDPLTQRVYWSYAGTEEEPFFSSLMGTAQRLPNGNTLITESDVGRVIEVTRDGEIVWEFRNPHTAGDRDEFVACIPELRRLPSRFARGQWRSRDVAKKGGSPGDGLR